MVRGVLVERCEKGWMEEDRVVTIVKCVDCRVSGMQPGGTWKRTTFETTNALGVRRSGRKRCGK